MALTLALSLIPLSIAGLAAVDLTRAVAARSRLQDSLDTATLAAARTVDPQSSPPSAADNAALLASGQSNLTQALGPNADLTVKGMTMAFGSSPDGQLVVADASATVKTALVHFIAGQNDLTITAHSEVLTAGQNVEVSLVVDITGSMCQPCTKLTALKSAANSLIDIVVRPQQTPYFSKLALVPYSTAVNAGGYAKALTNWPPSTFSFTADDGSWQTFSLSNCVTERIIPVGTMPTDDPVGSGKYLGRHYQPTSGPGGSSVADYQCPSTAFIPLTDDRAALKAAVNGLNAAGSTAGQIGLEVGWYMISPRFNGAWQTGKANPDNYFTKIPNKTVKVVVLMTDGLFNTAYNSGVVSQERWDTVGGSGASWSHINKDASNGSPFDQAKRLCDAMKQKDIVIYTVGFNLAAAGADQPKAQDILSYCATDPSHFFQPDTGQDLSAAFKDIANQINMLRISR